MTTYRLFPSTDGPASSTSFGGVLSQGILFEVTAGGLWLDGYWFWRADSSQSGSAEFVLWQATGGETGTVVANSSASVSGMAAGQWNYVPLAAPLALSQGTAYKATVGLTGNFPDTNGQFGSGDPYAAGITNGPLFAYSDSGGSAPDAFGDSQCSYTTVSADPSVQYPATANSSYNCWLDVQIDTAAPAGASYQIWPSLPNVLQAVSSDTTGYTLATEFSLSQACTLDAIWHYSPATAAALPSRCGIWNAGTQTEVAGTDNASPSWQLPDGGGNASAGDGWVYQDYTASGVTLAANTSYKVSTFHAAGSTWIAVTGNYWSTGNGASGIANGVIAAPDNAAASPGQGSYETLTWQYPSLSIAGGENYWIDVQVTPVVPPPVPPAYTASMSSM